MIQFKMDIISEMLISKYTEAVMEQRSIVWLYLLVLNNFSQMLNNCPQFWTTAPRIQEAATLKRQFQFGGWEGLVRASVPECLFLIILVWVGGS